MSEGKKKPGEGSIDYIEFVAKDLSAIKKFYAAAFAWDFTDYGPDYAGFYDGPRSQREREAGGFRQEAAAGGGSGTLAVLYSQDLEKTLQAVRDAGGTILQEIFSFPGGRRFHFKDPSGNELAVWSEDPAQG